MSKRKSKSQKLIDALIDAAERRALRGSRPPEEWEGIDEYFFLTKTHLQYYITQLELKIKSLSKETVQ